MSDHWTWPRIHGRVIMQRVLIEAQLRMGHHVHVANYSQDETCQGGDSECPLWALQLEEAMTVWRK